MTTSPPVHFPTPVEDPDAATLAHVIPLLNSISVTLDQIERGDKVYSGLSLTLDDYASLGGDGVHARKIQALRDWCRAEGLEPADLTAQAIFFRSIPIDQWAEQGVRDPKSEFPDEYAALATRLIDASYFGIWPGDHRFEEMKQLGFVSPEMMEALASRPAGSRQ
jgi:hypothetical protein